MKQTNEQDIIIMESMNTTQCETQEFTLENLTDTQKSNEGKINVVPITELVDDKGEALPSSEVAKLCNPNNYGVHIFVDGTARVVRPLTYSEAGDSTPTKIGFSEQAYFVRDSKSSDQAFRIWQNEAVTGG